MIWIVSSEDVTTRRILFTYKLTRNSVLKYKGRGMNLILCCVKEQLCEANEHRSDLLTAVVTSRLTSVGNYGWQSTQ